MTDPLTRRALDLLTRGHRLYAGAHVAAEPADTPELLRGHADRLARITDRAGTAAAGPVSGRLAADLHATAGTDADLVRLLIDARTDRELGRRATRTVLDEARAESLPAIDTALGQREVQRRMAARLREQHRNIRGSRRHARLLTGRMRQLTYPHRRGRRVSGEHAIPLPAVRYDKARPAGRVRDRIAQALDRRGIVDPAARRNWLRGYETLIARESGGRAWAIASEPATAPGPVQPDGHRLGYARGITQTLPATFAQYHQPGTSRSIYDPVANICASMNYVTRRYGVTADGANLVALVQQADRSRPPKGY